MRETIEKIIKDLCLDRSRIFEVSPLKYENIIGKIEKTFVKNNGELHWANIEERFNSCFTLKKLYIGKNKQWYQQLFRIIPNTLCYVLFEDTVNYQPKYWVYEMYPSEIITVINESNPNDFYIVSKKYKWLISECHEDIVYFLGDEIDISLIS